MIYRDFYPVTAIFHDSAGNLLDLKNIAVIEKGNNGICRFMDHNIGLLRNADNMIVGTLNNQVAYLSFKEFKKYAPKPDSNQVFVMKIIPEDEHDYLKMKAMMVE